MKLKRLSVTGFRNLQSVDISLSDGVNLFVGANGSGKTSILEVIHTLLLGHSFRSRKTKSLIHYDLEAFTLHGRLEDKESVTIPIGIYKDKSGVVQVKKSGERCASAAELAVMAPLILLNGHSFKLFEEGPDQRRKFLDWLLFHVEHRSFSVWKNYEKCLKQRNTLLRHDKIDHSALDVWEAELARYGNELHGFRDNLTELLEEHFKPLKEELPEVLGTLLFRYRPGWSADQPFEDFLRANRLRDSQIGYTMQGPHRSDFQILCDRYPVNEVLSRGQLKLLISALYMAQARVALNVAQKKPLFLLDDLAAELDINAQQLVANWVRSFDSQVFVSGIVSSDLEVFINRSESSDLSMFHVEHGKIIEK